ncbi:MAG: EAL domain-containing protein [Solirubrobacterales bacterium]|nr:EAL domain-containing protein [Solirubrobacterales bacterium]
MVPAASRRRVALLVIALAAVFVAAWGTIRAATGEARRQGNLALTAADVEGVLHAQQSAAAQVLAEGTNAAVRDEMRDRGRRMDRGLRGLTDDPRDLAALAAYDRALWRIVGAAAAGDQVATRDLRQREVSPTFDAIHERLERLETIHVAARDGARARADLLLDATMVVTLALVLLLLWRFEAARRGRDQAMARERVLSRDVAESEALAEQLRHRAFHDALTGLPNRALFPDRVERALAREARSSGGVAVLFVDLDDFKAVNDAHGHAGGDELLVAVAARLNGCLRGSDTAGRLGGDEFGALLDGVTGEAEAADVARRLLRAFATPVLVRGTPTTVTPSIGIALSGGAHDDADELLRAADLAMYAAKSQGKACSVVFRPELHSDLDRHGGRHDTGHALRATQERSEIAALLRRREPLQVVFQPVVDLRTGDIAGYEALSRFPALGHRPPEAVFAQAHRAGLGAELEAAAVAAALAAPGRPRRTALTLNVSPSALCSAAVDAVLPTDLCGIVLEVTEHELAHGRDELLGVLELLRDRGAMIAIDDAGAGYAGLRQLIALGPDVIKLDRSLVTGLHEDAAKRALVDSLVRFGARIGAQVCAEGIEVEPELRTLAELDVAYGQGYLLARPGRGWPPVEEAAAMACTVALQRALDGSELGGTGLSDDRAMAAISERLARIGGRRELREVVLSMATLLHADEVSFSVLDGHDLVVTVDHRFAGAGERWDAREFPATQRVLARQVAAQVFAGQRDADEAELACLRELHGDLRSVLMAPVVAGGVTVGLLEAFSFEARPWTRTEITRARLFGHQLGGVMPLVEPVVREALALGR